MSIRSLIKRCDMCKKLRRGVTEVGSLDMCPECAKVYEQWADEYAKEWLEIIERRKASSSDGVS